MNRKKYIPIIFRYVSFLQLFPTCRKRSPLTNAVPDKFNFLRDFICVIHKSIRFVNEKL